MTKPTKPTKPTKRKTGAQPGNSNAMRHGFYSRRFREIDKADLDKIQANINDEIAALRIAARRMFEYADQIGEKDPIEAIRAFSLFGNQVRAISGLLRTKSVIEGDSTDEDARAAIDAIVETAQGWVE
jgi:hypothetical protein